MSRDDLATIDEAQDIVSTTAQHTFSSLLLRLKGEILLNDEREMQNDERQIKKKGQTPSSIHRSSFIVHRSEEAEACFLQAITIARQQQAKSFELRAVMSLVRLRQHQAQAHVTHKTHHATRHTHHESRRKLVEAHRMLSELSDWFTEGFDTKDLQEAKALIEELNHRIVGWSGHCRGNSQYRSCTVRTGEVMPRGVYWGTLSVSFSPPSSSMTWNTDFCSPSRS